MCATTSDNEDAQSSNRWPSCRLPMEPPPTYEEVMLEDLPPSNAPRSLPTDPDLPPLYPTRSPYPPTFLDHTMPKLAMPAGIIASAGVMAGLTYVLVRDIKRDIDKTQVSNDTEMWVQKAKSEVYDKCYNGCNDCEDLSYAYNACKKTEELLKDHPNITCDSRKIWFWKHRYPRPCLEAQGEIFRKEALAAEKSKHWARLAFLILIIVFGIFIFVAVRNAFNYAINKMKARRAARRVRWPGARQPQQTREHRWGSRATKARAFCSLLPLFSRPANAYLCLNRDPIAYEYLTNHDNTVRVHVHSWVSDCANKEVCDDVFADCSWELFSDKCNETREDSCVEITHTVKTPHHYVEQIVPFITQCGFRISNEAFEAPHLRLPNPGFEKYWSVKVAVNGFNVTDPHQVNREIQCLYDIGNGKAEDHADS